MVKNHRIRTCKTDSAEVCRFGLTKCLYSSNGDVRSIRYFPEDAEDVLLDSDRLLLESRPIQAAVAEILKLDGVVSVAVKHYEVEVEIGLAFDWSEISAATISILKKLFKDEEVDIQDNVFSGVWAESEKSRP
ncbi:MAG: hypothetical protein JST44_26030 [Cyanobacteria bacterium SZAS LIN-5]|nr:hypothetical protein [Cyanobacteria bacterium SZAS LIN-5]RTL41868.1 MAG: hypothetical protein EKK48_13200 [Candidatus Melainabacteria bacterium]